MVLLSMLSVAVSVLLTGRRRVSLSIFHTAADVFAKWEKSSWGQKNARRRALAATTDFDRYKAAVKKTQRGRAIAAAAKKLEK